jgi:short-subunit dehydrogenase
VAAEPRSVFITGASSGLGQGLALWFARRGARVFAAARRAERLQALATDSGRGTGSIEAVAVDVADTTAIRKALLRADDAVEDGLDLVIANAGVGGNTNPRKDETWPLVERMLKVNVLGAAATLSALAPRMAERKRGHLVGISSIAAWVVAPRSGTYTATKIFLEVYCAGLRIDLRGTGVAVTSIHPGFVKSEMTAQNKAPMPMLLETDDAVERMGRAILRRPTRFAFPWQMALAARTAQWLPEGLRARAIRR